MQDLIEAKKIILLGLPIDLQLYYVDNISICTDQIKENKL